MNPLNCLRSVLLAIGTALLLSACATTNTSSDSDHYVLVRADQTQLLSAANDQGNVILAFRQAVQKDLEFFDHQGQPLKTISKGKLVCVGGLHRGILIRNKEAVSYVSVRPGARLQDGPAMAVSEELRLLRRQVTIHEPAEQAMKLALAAIDTRQANPSGSALISAQTTTGQADDDEPLALALRQWRQTPAIDLPPSQLNDKENQGYIVFLPGALMPVQAEPVINRLAQAIGQQSGVLLISGITPRDAPDPVVELARQRARLVRQILISQGVDPDKLTISAVYRSGTHSRRNPGRPEETVGLTWLRDS